jgi:hypothetical protein
MKFIKEIGALQQLSSKKRNSVTGSLILFLGESNYF